MNDIVVMNDKSCITLNFKQHVANSGFYFRQRFPDSMLEVVVIRDNDKYND
jgi:hypothetical protein